MTLKQKSIHAISWNLMDKMLKRLVQFVMSIFLARLLAPSDFGTIAMVGIFTSWAIVFQDFGLGQSIIQHKEVSKIQYSTIFYLNVIMGLLIAIVFVCLAPVAARFYNNEAVAWVLRIAALTFFINALNVVQAAQLSKALNFKVGTIASLIASLVSGIIGVIMAFTGFGIWSLMFQGLISSIIVVIYFWMKSSWRPSWQFSFKETKPMFKQGVGFLGQGLVSAIFTSIDSMVIGKIYSPALLGLFNRGKTLADMPRDTIILPISRPLFPIFAKIQDNIDWVRKKHLDIINMLNWGIICIIGFMFANAKEIILLLFGQKWEGSIFFFKAWLLMSLFYVGNTVSVSVWKALGKTAFLAKITLLERWLMTLSLIGGLAISVKMFVVCCFISYIITFLLRTFFDYKIGLNAIGMYKQWLLNILIVVMSLLPTIFITCSSLFLSLVIKGCVFFVMYIVIAKIVKLDGQRQVWDNFGKAIKIYVIKKCTIR